MFNYLKNVLGKSTTKEDVQKKGLEGITYYKKGEFPKAVEAFEKYFELKGQGKFPELDRDDSIMLLNLGNAMQYSKDYKGAIYIYESVKKLLLNWNAPYLMVSICSYKLGEVEKAKSEWELARHYGNEKAQVTFELGIEQF